MKNYYRIMLGRKSVHAEQCFTGGFSGADYGITEDLTGKLPDDWRSFNAIFIPKYLETHKEKTKIGADLPVPDILCEETGLWFSFTFSEKQPDATTQETIQETTQEKILYLLKLSPAITRRELSEKVGITEYGIKYQLKKLTDAGKIRHVGSTKAGFWELLQ